MASLILQLDEIPSIPNHDEPSSEILEELISELRARRNSANLKTLEQLAKNCIMQNAIARFVPASGQFSKKANNPFEILPNSLALNLLEDALKMTKNSKLISLCLVLQLLNPQIVQFDFEKLNKHDENEIITIFTHLLKNCPKIRSIQINKTIWENFTSPERKQPEDIFAMMAYKWPNLNSLDFDYLCPNYKDYNNYYNDDRPFVKHDDLLEAISSNLPDLVSLKAKLSMKTFTMAGVEHLSKMNKLKHLELHLFHIHSEEHPFSIVVHAAGRVPGLQKFTFKYLHNKFWGSFPDMYGKLYPNKPLVVDLTTREDLKSAWPSCLTLENWTVCSNRNFFVGNNLYKNLMKGNESRVEKLIISDISVHEAYLLVEKFGPRGLEQLSLDLTCKRLNYHDIVDAARIVSACPKISSLTISINGKYRKESPYLAKITPQHFNNCHIFQTHVNGDIQRLRYISELDQMWVLGSRASGKRCVKFENLEQIEQILSLLHLKVPTALDQVETVEFSIVLDQGEQLEKLLQVIFLLILRSPNLQFLLFSNFCNLEELNAPNWLQHIVSTLKINVCSSSSIEPNVPQNIFCG